MKVQDLMSREPRTCGPDDRLHEVARTLWDHDCGCVPVVDEKGHPIGMLTDRDVCMAAYTQGRRLDELSVRSAMAKNLATCRADDHVDHAFAQMRQRQVRRLPVVDAGGRLIGLLSTNDALRHAVQSGQGEAVERVVATLAAIGAPRRSPEKARSPEKPVVVPAPAPAATLVAAFAPPAAPPKPPASSAAPARPAGTVPAPVAPPPAKAAGGAVPAGDKANGKNGKKGKGRK